MGFDPLGFYQVFDKQPYKYHTITREELTYAIEKGISSAELTGTLAENLRRVARENEYIAVGTWGVKTDIDRKKYCGCPLTEAGYIKINPNEQGDLSEITEVHGYEDFWTTFDDTASPLVRDRNGFTLGSGFGGVVVKVV